MAATGSTARDGRGTSASRWRWAVPALLLLAWLVVAAVGGPFAGRLAEVQTNDNASFLPRSAEATVVNDVQEEFAEDAVLPAVVVYELDRAVTEADLAAVAEDVAGFRQLDAVVGDPSPPIPAEDGRAVQVVVPLDGADADDAALAVEDLRAALAERYGDDPSVAVYVTGPAGFLADFGEAFGEIDGLLLGVALTAVLVILLVVYRSPILPFLVLLSSLFALAAASMTVYFLADGGLLTLNGQSQGILFILVVGAATDYALLLVSRYREELRATPRRWTAMSRALRGAWEPIAASGTTVILGVLCLLFSELNSNRGLGPVAAIGIAFSMLVALTFLPAALVVLGRVAFWPFRPAYGSAGTESRGAWARVAGVVSRRPRRVWVLTALALGVLAAFLPRFESDGVSQSDFFLTSVEATEGQDALARHFPAGSGSPAVVVTPEDRVADVLAVLDADAGVAQAAPQVEGEPGPQSAPQVVDGRVLVNATLTDAADSAAAEDTVVRLRAALDDVGEDVLVGGPTAIQYDVLESSARDRTVIIPLVLIVIFVVLAVLLRSLLAPALLLVANVLSFAATLGAAAIVFTWVLDFPGSDPAVPLYGFIFLVALGIDYSIFLMTRVREESLRIGTRPGIRKGLAVTGGVITSAGVVLAATFSALAVLPILFLAQIAFIVAFGVLLDTFVVRSLLVPALSYDIGARVWWPGRLGRADSGARAEPTPEPVVAGGRT